MTDQGIDFSMTAPAVLQIGTTSTTLPQPRLVKAAHEFEAAMMKELMTSLEPGHDSLGGSDEGGGSFSALGAYAGEALGKAISEHGGFGIAQSIIGKLSPRGNHSGKTPVPENNPLPATKSSFQ